VRRSIWRGEFTIPKSKTSVRRIDLTPYLAAELKKYVLASPKNDLDLVFCNSEGKPIDPDSLVKREFLPALKKNKAHGAVP
jgi:hypothetical protein